MYTEEELDCAFNKISPYIHENLSGETGIQLLKDITHVIDCECFRTDGELIFREVSIFDLRTLKFENLHCFAENFCSYYEMSERNKYIVRRTQRIHGLFFYNTRVKKYFLSQNELFCYLKKKYNEKDILFSYKGGDIESNLCKEIRIPAVNIEHFGVEKYEILLKHFKIDLLSCKHHNKHISSHCSLYEVMCFAARICEKICNIEKLKKILVLYKEK